MTAKKHAYVLMVDKIGWDSLANVTSGINREYMRTYADLPEFDVPKGALVEVDPDSLDFKMSLNVICLDGVGSLHPKWPLSETSDENESLVKLSVIFKELLPIEQEVYEMFVPLKPSSRYAILTSESLLEILSCKVGQLVDYSPKPFGWTERSLPGIIQYIGPLKQPRGSSYGCVGAEETPGTWVGVELIESRAGNCDGRFNGVRYFSAQPLGAVFTTIDHLRPLRENELSLSSMPKSKKVVREGRSASLKGNFSFFFWIIFKIIITAFFGLSSNWCPFW